MADGGSGGEIVVPLYDVGCPSAHFEAEASSG